MPTYKCVASLPARSGVSADLHVNTLHIERSDWGQGVNDQMADNFASLYDDLYTLGLMSGYDLSLGELKTYQRPTVAPDYPIATSAITGLSAGRAFNMPPELAVCVSYMNDTAASTPRGRRRGRIYLGGATSDYNSADGRIAASKVTATLNAFTSFVTLCNNTVGELHIWSQAAGASFLVQRVWVDNEWDIQRRRGRKATDKEETVIDQLP